METKQQDAQVKNNVTTTIHESKHFPFQVVEINSTDIQTEETNVIFKIGVGGAILSEKEFKTMENANKYIGGRPWELITNLICFTIQNAMEYERNSKK